MRTMKTLKLTVILAILAILMTSCANCDVEEEAVLEAQMELEKAEEELQLLRENSWNPLEHPLWNQRSYRVVVAKSTLEKVENDLEECK